MNILNNKFIHNGSFKFILKYKKFIYKKDLD